MLLARHKSDHPGIPPDRMSRPDRAILVLLVVAGLCGFVVDCFNVEVFAGGVFYAPVVFVGLLRRSERLTWVGSGAATLMTLVAFFLPRIPTDLPTALLNRSLSLLAIAITTGLVLRQLRLMRQLAAETERAAAAGQAKGRFLQHVSHEMRTPLNAVIGFADLLTPSCRPDQVEPLVHIGDAAQHLLRGVENMLDLASADARVLRAEPLDLPKLAQRTVQAFTAAAAQKSIALLFEAAPGLRACGDEWAVDRILGALLDNAIKFTPPGGMVAVEIRVAAGAALIYVDDDGVGIGEAAQARLGVPFRENDPLLAQQGEGLGLGLALATVLAARMQGSIEIDRHRAVGTSIALRLPAAA
jgi:signal transduction histidine kinase